MGQPACDAGRGDQSSDAPGHPATSARVTRPGPSYARSRRLLRRPLCRLAQAPHPRVLPSGPLNPPLPNTHTLHAATHLSAPSSVRSSPSTALNAPLLSMPPRISSSCRDTNLRASEGCGRLSAWGAMRTWKGGRAVREGMQGGGRWRYDGVVMAFPASGRRHAACAAAMPGPKPDFVGCGGASGPQAG